MVHDVAPVSRVTLRSPGTREGVECVRQTRSAPSPLVGEGSAPFTWQLLSIVMNRIRINLLATLVCCVLTSVAASAPSFPPRPIRLIVPSPPAGITDLSARLVAEGLRVRFNQPVIVENRPGANGLLGLREMLKAEPDGYTLIAGTVGNLVIRYSTEGQPAVHTRCARRAGAR